MKQEDLMHPSVFEYLMPTEEQHQRMAQLRAAYAELASALLNLAPDGWDASMAMHYLRTSAMWANVSITRNPDGSPRS